MSALDRDLSGEWGDEYLAEDVPQLGWRGRVQSEPRHGIEFVGRSAVADAERGRQDVAGGGVAPCCLSKRVGVIASGAEERPDLGGDRPANAHHCRCLMLDVPRQIVGALEVAADDEERDALVVLPPTDVEVPDPAQVDPIRNPNDLDGSGEVSDVGVGERTVGIEDHDDARSGSDESADLGSQPPLHVVIRTTSRSRAPGRVKPASPEIRAAA